MRKFFLISLMTLLTSVWAWGIEAPQAPSPFMMNQRTDVPAIEQTKDVTSMVSTKKSTPAKVTAAVKEDPEPVAVAQIGEETYTTLQAAINAAASHATIELLADVTENVIFDTTDTITLTGGFTITGKTTLKDKVQLTLNGVHFANAAGDAFSITPAKAKVEIILAEGSNNSVYATANDKYGFNITNGQNNSNKSVLTINGDGTMKVYGKKYAFYGGNYTQIVINAHNLYASAGESKSVMVSSTNMQAGHFKENPSVNLESKYAIAFQENTAVEIEGNSSWFYVFTPGVNDVACNHESAKVYTSLGAAIADAKRYQTIYLYQTTDEVISVNKNVMIELIGQDVACDNVTAAENFHRIESQGNGRKGIAFSDAEIYLDRQGDERKTFYTLLSAFSALPEYDNSTPVKITLNGNASAVYDMIAVTLNPYHNVTIDLNGDTIFAKTTTKGTSALITNKGTLTIMDSSDDGSGNGTGMITNENSNVEFWTELGQPYPYVAHNLITNLGTCIINGGRLECYGGGAAYVVDNQNSGNNTPTLIINGGYLYNPQTSAIRLCTNGDGLNSVIVNGGVIEAYSPIWLQTYRTTSKGTIEIHGGEILSRTNCYYYANHDNPEGRTTCSLQDASGQMYVYGGKTSPYLNVKITGGIINENIGLWDGANLTVTGGRFNGYVYMADWNKSKLSGGLFDYYQNTGLVTDAQLLPGFVWKKHGEGAAVGIEEGHELWEVVPAGSAVINKDTLDANNNEYELKTIEEALEEGETMEGTIVSIVGAGGAALEQSSDTVIVTVEAGDTVQVHGISGAAEGQLVVKDGATLVIGNGGIVSTNDTLTQIVVEAGGTVAVGIGGVNQQGDATPIEIQSDGEKSGVLLIDPNAPDSVAQAIAKVVVYTRAYKQGGVEHWQQFASPVKGNTIKVTPLGTIGENSQLKTSVYSWDYNTDSWVRIIKASEDDGMDLVPGTTDVYAFSGGSSWITSDAVLKPFAAYDLINNSLPSHGGISYEFAGELVGNNDLVLSFPEKGFCLFGNSYTAPIDLVTFFEKIKNDMKADSIVSTNTAIDPCVYLFNSEKNRFESVNSLKLKRWQTKGTEIPFTQIPPQQAFVMNLLKGNSAQSSISYATSVWSNPQSKNIAIMAPKRQEESTISAMVEIHVTDGNATDQVLLVQDDEYNNEYDLGADAMKYMDGAFNLYANTTIGKLDVVATDDIENTELSFQAGNSVNYTMSFNNVEGDFVLVDRANNSQVTIEEGGIYTFAAQPNNTIEGRFAIVPAAKMPTAIGNTEVKTNAKGIYTIMGQYLGENFDILPAGVYVIDGVKIVK